MNGPTNGLGIISERIGSDRCFEEPFAHRGDNCHARLPLVIRDGNGLIWQNPASISSKSKMTYDVEYIDRVACRALRLPRL